MKETVINGSVFQLKPDRCGVLILDPETGDPVAYAKARQPNGDPSFLVTASRHHDGRIWYSYGLADRTIRALGLEGAGYAAERALARRLTTEDKPCA